MAQLRPSAMQIKEQPVIYLTMQDRCSVSEFLRALFEQRANQPQLRIIDAI